jgi:uncharacterized protein YjiS (DUF1127 family)
MSTPIHPAAPALPQLPTVLGETARVLAALAQRLDAWLKHRRRARQDREALAGMSDRELADIGLDRGSVDAVAGGAWTRDDPC